MLFLRRLRKRRAKKSASKIEKNAKATTKKGQSIFRGEKRSDAGKHAPEVVVDPDESLYPNGTLGTLLTDEFDDNSSSTPSPYGRLMSLDKTQRLCLKHKAAMVQNYEALVDLHAEIEALKVAHEEDLEGKDERIFDTLVELGFAKEDVQMARNEIEIMNEILESKEEENNMMKELLNDKQEELDQTITDLEEIKETLAALGAELDESRKSNEAKDETIVALERSIRKGTTGAKVVLGLLTLGALCSDDH